MTKTEIIETLKTTGDHLTEIIRSSDAFLVSHGGTTLNVKTINGKPVFYNRTKAGTQTCVKSTDEKRIRTLCTAYHAKKIRSAALKERKQIEACLAILAKEPDASDVVRAEEKIRGAIMKNAVLSELTNEGYARKWQDGNDVVRKYRSHRKDDYHRYATMRGDYVGSKSEVMIADRLYARGVPYHYEIAFTPEAVADKSRPVYDEMGFVIGYDALGYGPDAEDTLHPDFYVLNKRTRKAVFWEHLGKMDDPEYCRKNFNRFMRILDAGYIIGEDVIVTHEDSRHPLLPQDIDGIIDRYLM